MAFLAIAALHFVCCGLPLLLLSGVSIGALAGVSIAFLAKSWPILAGTAAVLGVVGFVWYLKRGCATCPRNEGCKMKASKVVGP
ncbi:MAG: hypothetical protein JHD15_07495 [Phenylobacterium sp.]|uniref:hypothetical protein n=1 Tax=Phenylobacterium sp. TaxID=1871053 RepID=UPI001A290E28|nr:hypothetical protein [Phenylobacterium sp.]MBJ7410195.1 hypothetical protein [Phenylobacterium sp.]